MSEPIEPALRESMNGIAEVLSRALGAGGYGFALLVFKMGEGDDHRMNYISNAQREDMISALKELLANFEGRVVESPGKGRIQ